MLANLAMRRMKFVLVRMGYGILISKVMEFGVGARVATGVGKQMRI